MKGRTTRSWHLFEFMDVAGIPAGLRRTLREILECGNMRPFRTYYDWAAGKVEHEARQGNFRRIVELGAGTAPITRFLAKSSRDDAPTLIPCDMHPDIDAYRSLETAYPRLVAPIFTPVDFSQPCAWQSDTLLFLSATFHHVLPEARLSALEALLSSGRRIVICEPLQNRLSSFGYALLSILPAMLLPLLFINRPGRLRRSFWCWLAPVAPLMFCWDGLVSCLRQWDANEWQAAAMRLGITIQSFEALTFSYCVVLERPERAAREVKVSRAVGH